jgi:cysteine synthase
MTRDLAAKKARRRGASTGTHVTAATEVLVQGSPSPNHKWVDLGVKLAEVCDTSSTQHICVTLHPHWALACSSAMNV